jgi:carbon-monoxide dehydrogenase medium subunit
MGAERQVAAQDFFEGLFTTVIEEDELLTEINVPAKKPNTGYAFSELARRHGDYAHAGVAAIITLDGEGICRQARLVYLSAGDIPMVAGKAAAMMVGEAPVDQLVDEAAHFASRHEIEATADIHASAEYKRHLAYILGKRTIQQAISNARTKLQP